jgi:hypothetical protein
MTMNSYQTAYWRRVNGENLARQAPEVKKTIREILDQLHSIEQCLYWAIDPEENPNSMWPSSLVEHAHALLDLGHDYRAALAAHPPPKDPDDNAA